MMLFVLCLGACAGGEKSCVRAGCSGELCVEEGAGAAASTCEWTDKYRCYQTSGTCERQESGKCGWTPTDALSSCMSKVNSRPPFLPASIPQ